MRVKGCLKSGLIIFKDISRLVSHSQLRTCFVESDILDSKEEGDREFSPSIRYSGVPGRLPCISSVKNMAGYASRHCLSPPASRALTVLASVLARASLRISDSNKLQPTRLLTQQTGLSLGEGCLSHLANEAEASSKSPSVYGLILGAISRPMRT